MESKDRREPERGNQPDHAPKTRPEWARAWARFLNRGLWLHAKVEPGSVRKRKDLPHLRGHGREPGMDSDKRRPQAPGVEAGITGT